MKPKIFIGSSTEKLEIAYGIQENLNFDATVTVWTQGIFDLSNSSLDALIKALDDFDFAIFVFHPDDVISIRDRKFNTVRDNLIFELGLFIGRLGKNKVFFLVPTSVDKLHLPTDLLGISPGYYDNKREDGNIQASLGAFCNQVRKKLKDFYYQNLDGIQNETAEIKKIVIDRKKNWGVVFAMSLLVEKMKPINNSFVEFQKGFNFNRIQPVEERDFISWTVNFMSAIGDYTDKFKLCLEGINQSAKIPDENSNKAILIRNSVERLILLSNELVKLENDLLSIKVSDRLGNMQLKMKNLTKEMIIDFINDFGVTTLGRINLHNDETNEYIFEPFEGSIVTPANLFAIVEEMTNYTNQVQKEYDSLAGES